MPDYGGGMDAATRRGARHDRGDGVARGRAARRAGLRGRGTSPATLAGIAVRDRRQTTRRTPCRARAAASCSAASPAWSAWPPASSVLGWRCPASSTSARRGSARSTYSLRDIAADRRLRSAQRRARGGRAGLRGCAAGRRRGARRSARADADTDLVAGARRAAARRAASRSRCWERREAAAARPSSPAVRSPPCSAWCCSSRWSCHSSAGWRVPCHWRRGSRCATRHGTAAVRLLPWPPSRPRWPASSRSASAERATARRTRHCTTPCAPMGAGVVQVHGDRPADWEAVEAVISRQLPGAHITRLLGVPDPLADGVPDPGRPGLTGAVGRARGECGPAQGRRRQRPELVVKLRCFGARGQEDLRRHGLADLRGATRPGAARAGGGEGGDVRQRRRGGAR